MVCYNKAEYSCMSFFPAISHIYICIYTHHRPPHPACPPTPPKRRDPLYMLHGSFLNHHLTGIRACAESSSPSRYLCTYLSTSRNRIVTKHNPTQLCHTRLGTSSATAHPRDFFHGVLPARVSCSQTHPISPQRARQNLPHLQPNPHPS